jgi:hypothetical protein
MTPRSILALALVLAAPGCLGTRHGRPERIGTRNVQEFSRADLAEPIQWRRVLVGAPRPKVRGYVKTSTVEVARRTDSSFHFVYDSDFHLVGRISSTGETRRIDADGAETSEGSYALEHGVLVLLGGAREDTVTLAPMPSPRG